MFNFTTRFFVKRLAKTRDSKFTAISSKLSILAYVLATIAITVVTTVTNSLTEYQKSRFLDNRPHVIVSYENYFNTQDLNSRNLDPTKLELVYQQLLTLNQSKQAIKDNIIALTPYAGGTFFLQHDSALVEGNIIGIDSEKQHSWENANSLASIPEVVSNYHFTPGAYELIVPDSLLFQYNLSVGQEVNLINSTKSQYLPTGQIPISRPFKIVASYQSQSDNSSWFASVFDIARLDQRREINQVAIYLKNPFNIEEFTTALITKYNLTNQSDFVFVVSQQASNSIYNSDTNTTSSNLDQINNQIDGQVNGQDNGQVNGQINNQDNGRVNDQLVAQQNTNYNQATSYHNTPTDSATATEQDVITTNDTTSTNNNSSPISNLEPNSTAGATATHTTEPPDALPQPNTVVQVEDWRNDLALIFNSIKTETRTTTTLTSLLIIIAILSSLITFSFLLVEKDYEIAMFNVLGMTPWQISNIFMLILARLILRANLYSIILFVVFCYTWPWTRDIIGIPVDLTIDYIQVAITYLACTGVVLGSIMLAGQFIIHIRPAQILR